MSTVLSNQEACDYRGSIRTGRAQRARKAPPLSTWDFIPLWTALVVLGSVLMVANAHA